MQESWSDEPPDLPSTFDFLCVLPSKGVQRPWIRGKEVCVHDSVEPHRYYEHSDVHNDYEYCKRAHSDCRAKVNDHSVHQSLVSSSLVQAVRRLLPWLLDLGIGPAIHAAKKALSLFVLVAAAVPTLFSFLFSPSSFSLFSKSLQICH